MLPFLQPKKVGAVISVLRKEDGSSGGMKEKDEPNPGLMAAAEDLIKAVHAKDAKAVCEALEAAYMECDSDDGDEGAEESEAMCNGGEI